MIEKNGRIQTQAQELWMSEEGIIMVRAFPGAYSNREDAEAAIDAAKMLAGDKKYPVLIDIREGLGASRDSFKIYSGEKAASMCKAAALIKGTPLSNMMANFFIGIYKTKYPMKLFDDPEKAIEWLKTFEG